MTRILKLFLLISLPLATLSGQNPPVPQLQSRAASPAANSEITLDVQVTDKSGAPVRGLQKEDFTLLDNKRPQSIISFHSVGGSVAKEYPPVEVILVIDAVNSPFLTVAREREDVTRFLARHGGEIALPTSIVMLSDSGMKVQQNPTRDGAALAAQLDQLKSSLRTVTRSQGIYGAEDRLNLSLKGLNSLLAYESKRPSRKLMIWFTPEWPPLTMHDFELSNAYRQSIFADIVKLTAGLRDSRVTLFSVDPRGLQDISVRNTLYEEYLKGVTAPNKAMPGNISLQVLAVQSGGRVLTSINDLASAIATCTADADAFYVLSFAASPADRADEYHSLAIKIDKPNLIVRTRTGYYAQP